MAGVVTQAWVSGYQNLVPDVNGHLTLNHGLGVKPGFAAVTLQARGAVTVYCDTFTTTTIRITFTDAASGAPWGNGAQSIAFTALVA